VKYVKHYECTLCHKTFPKEQDLFTCPECGELGILDIIYDYELMKQEVNADYFKNNRIDSIWRYLPMLSVKAEFTKNTLRVGMTPLYKAINLGKYLHMDNLFVKDEGVNPTQSLKDRASVVAVVKALEKNQKIIACSSTGNAASSLAGNAAKANLKTVIFVPKRAPIGKLAQLMIYGSTVIKVDGDYKAAFSLSKLAIEANGWYNRNAAINPHLVEGKKTVALEIAEQLGFKTPDWVVVSVGDGCTIAGVYKGFYDLLQLGLIPKIPRLLGVQSAGCAPFYNAYINNLPLVPTEENTIADSIAVGIPRNPVKAMNAVKYSLGSWIAVTDQEIMQAMKLLGHTEGIFSEPAAAASLAGLIKAIEVDTIKLSDTVVFISTGNGLKDTKNALEAIEEPVTLPNNIDRFNEYMKIRRRNNE